MAEYFEDELSIDITQEKYQINGALKAKRLRAFIELEDTTRHLALENSWQYKCDYKPEDPQEKANCLYQPKLKRVSASVLATFQPKPKF